MLKKITAALLAAVMALSLTACSGGDEKQECFLGIPGWGRTRL